MTTLVTIRPGVTLEARAAASFRRAEAAWGREITTTFTYRAPELQQKMLDQWNAWLAGKGPKPPFYRPISPRLSWHVKGLAIDSDDYKLKGFRALMEDHGWRWVVSDEAWHMQYYAALDRHRNEPAGDDSKPFTPDNEEDDDMGGFAYMCDTNKAYYWFSLARGKSRKLSSDEVVQMRSAERSGIPGNEIHKVGEGWYNNQLKLGTYTP